MNFMICISLSINGGRTINEENDYLDIDGVPFIHLQPERLKNNIIDEIRKSTQLGIASDHWPSFTENSTIKFKTNTLYDTNVSFDSESNFCIGCDKKKGRELAVTNSKTDKIRTSEYKSRATDITAGNVPRTILYENGVTITGRSEEEAIVLNHKRGPNNTDQSYAFNLTDTSFSYFFDALVSLLNYLNPTLLNFLETNIRNIQQHNKIKRTQELNTKKECVEAGTFRILLCNCDYCITGKPDTELLMVSGKKLNRNVTLHRLISKQLKRSSDNGSKSIYLKNKITSFKGIKSSQICTSTGYPPFPTRYKQKITNNLIDWSKQKKEPHPFNTEHSVTTSKQQTESLIPANALENIFLINKTSGSLFNGLDSVHIATHRYNKSSFSSNKKIDYGIRKYFINYRIGETDWNTPHSDTIRSSHDSYTTSSNLNQALEVLQTSKSILNFSISENPFLKSSGSFPNEEKNYIINSTVGKYVQQFWKSASSENLKIKEGLVEKTNYSRCEAKKGYEKTAFQKNNELPELEKGQNGFYEETGNDMITLSKLSNYNFENSGIYNKRNLDGERNEYTNTGCSRDIKLLSTSTHKSTITPQNTLIVDSSNTSTADYNRNRSLNSYNKTVSLIDENPFDNITIELLSKKLNGIGHSEKNYNLSLGRKTTIKWEKSGKSSKNAKRPELISKVNPSPANETKLCDLGQYAPDKLNILEPSYKEENSFDLPSTIYDGSEEDGKKL